MAPAGKKRGAKSAPPPIEGEILAEIPGEETVPPDASRKSGRAGRGGDIFRRFVWYLTAAGVIFIAGLFAAPTIQEGIDSLLGRGAPAAPLTREDVPAPSQVDSTDSIDSTELAEEPTEKSAGEESAPPPDAAKPPEAAKPVEAKTTSGDAPAGDGDGRAAQEVAVRPSVAAVGDALAGETMAADYRKLTERLRALEARLAQMEQLGGAVSAVAGADRMLLALARLSQRVDAGQTYGGEMLEFRAFFAALPAAARDAKEAHMRVLAAEADSGVKNAAMLGRAFADVLPAALATAALPQDAGWWDRVWAQLKGVVVVRRVGQVEGAGAEAVLARAEFDLGRGDIAAALVEVQSLEARIQDILAPWQGEAAKSLAVRRALDALIETYSARSDIWPSASPAPGSTTPKSQAEGG